LSLKLRTSLVIVFEPVTHSAQFLAIGGEPTRERQQLSIVFTNCMPDRNHGIASRPLRLTLETSPTCACCRRSGSPAMPCPEIVAKRQADPDRQADADQPDLRDVYRRTTLNHRPAAQDTSLTFCSPTSGSTALYERVGDLAAFDLVRAHFPLRCWRSSRPVERRSS